MGRIPKEDEGAEGRTKKNAVCVAAKITFYSKFFLSIYVTITSSDLVSDTTPSAPVTEIDEDSAYTETHDTLRRG